MSVASQQHESKLDQKSEQKPLRKDTLLTRKRILDAAEQLFYERGIDNVGLSDINQAAQQKNRNAVQYHFGSKLALLQAIMERHSEQIQAEREGIIEGLAESENINLRELMTVLVKPLTSRMQSKSGQAFISICAQLLSSKRYRKDLLSRTSLIEDDKVFELLTLLETRFTALFEQPFQVLRAREALITSMVFQSMATAVADEELEHEVFVEALVDAMVAISSQEPSAQTLSQIKD